MLMVAFISHFNCNLTYFDIATHIEFLSLKPNLTRHRYMAPVHTGAKRVQLLVGSGGVGAPWEEKKRSTKQHFELKGYVLQNDPVAMPGVTLHIHISGTSAFF